MLAHHLAEHRRRYALSPPTSMVPPLSTISFNRQNVLKTELSDLKKINSGDGDHAPLSTTSRTLGNHKKSQEEKHPSGQSSKGFKKNYKVCPVEWKDVPRFAVSVSSHKNIPKTAGVPQTGQSAAWTTIPPPVRVSAASLSHSLSLMPFRREKCGNTVTSIHWWWWRLHKWYIYI